MIPVLRPGQTVVMDNAAIHKSKEAEQLIGKAGCELLFLPPYAPDVNPIEKTLDAPLTDVIELDSIPPVQDSAIANLSFFLLRIDTIFLLKLMRKTSI